jgi:hypothetical protein
MKTLQEQYNLIKNGKGHKGVFLKEAKRLFPNIVPNAVGFKQASKLLKQRNIINENVFPLIPSSGLNPFTTFDKFVNEEVKATETKTTKKVNQAETAGYDYKDPKNLDNQIFDQYLNGLKFEMEENAELLADNPSEALLKAKDIVAKNLEKDPLFYMKNAAFGVKDLGYTELENGKEPTGKHKSSGYGDLKENKMNKSTQLKELLEEAVAGIPSIGNPFMDRKKATYEDKFAAFLAEQKEETKEEKETKEEGYGAREYEKGKKAGENMTKEEKEPAKEEKVMKKEEMEPKKEGKKKFQDVVKEVEKVGEMAKAKVAMEMYGGMKKKMEETLNSINEDTNLQEFIDEGKKGELQKEIALYEKYYTQAEANYNNNSSHK